MTKAIPTIFFTVIGALIGLTAASHAEPVGAQTETKQIYKQENEEIYLNKEVELTHVLTLITILISAIALTLSWSRDRKVRIRSQANAIRTAAANTLTKLDRWQTIQLSLYDELQPVFVETSEMFSKEISATEIRDHLWKTVAHKKASILYRMITYPIFRTFLDGKKWWPSICVEDQSKTEREPP